MNARTKVLTVGIALLALAGCSSTQDTSPRPVAANGSHDLDLDYSTGLWIITEKDADRAKTKPVCPPGGVIKKPSQTPSKAPSKAPTTTPPKKAEQPKKLDLQKKTETPKKVEQPKKLDLKKPSTPPKAKKTALTGNVELHHQLVAASKPCTTKTVSPADWDITIRNSKTGETHEIEVSKATFDRVYVGQVYTG